VRLRVLLARHEAGVYRGCTESSTIPRTPARSPRTYSSRRTAASSRSIRQPVLQLAVSDRRQRGAQSPAPVSPGGRARRRCAIPEPSPESTAESSEARRCLEDALMSSVTSSACRSCSSTSWDARTRRSPRSSDFPKNREVETVQRPSSALRRAGETRVHAMTDPNRLTELMHSTWTGERRRRAGRVAHGARARPRAREDYRRLFEVVQALNGSRRWIRPAGCARRSFRARAELTGRRRQSRGAGARRRPGCRSGTPLPRGC